jgi:hypothetical protein
MITRVEFEYNDYEVVARGKVMFNGYIPKVELYFRNIEEVDYPRGKVLSEISDLAEELLIEERFTPSVKF